MHNTLWVYGNATLTLGSKKNIKSRVRTVYHTALKNKYFLSQAVPTGNANSLTLMAPGDISLEFAYLESAFKLSGCVPFQE